MLYYILEFITVYALYITQNYFIVIYLFMCEKKKDLNYG